MSFDADLRAQLDERLRAALEDAQPPPPLAAAPEPAELLSFGLGGRGPLRLAKRVLRRLLREVLGRQVAFNRDLKEHLDAMRAEAIAAARRAEIDERAVREGELRSAALEEALAQLREQSAAQAQELAQLQAAQGNARSRLALLDGEDAAGEIDYLGLTDRFRGSETEIAARQRAYVPHFAGQERVLDLGCGRGEFLALLQAARIPALGVDLEPAMVSHCSDLGLEAVCADALAHLEAQPAGSLGGVFAAQLIEHLQPHRIVQLMALAHARLRSGGVLLLETVNPQSLMTFAGFYIDPTHVKPVHPLTLEWLARTLGYESVELRYTSEPPAERLLRPFPDAPAPPAQVAAWDAAAAHTNSLLYGPQEYAIIARRP
ncbi:MAG: hypothetical protein NVSMB51_21680 [Solirubrobacteraceae bacterium]